MGHATKVNVDSLLGFVLSPRDFAERHDLSLKCEIRRYGQRLAKALPGEQQQLDMEKFCQALEQLAEEVERVERRLAAIEFAD